MSKIKENIGAFICGGLLAVLVVLVFLHKLGFFSFISW